MKRGRLCAARIMACALALVTVLTTARLGAEDLRQWQSSGPYGGLIWHIEVDPTAPRRVLAKTTQGTFISTNAGARWERISLPEGFPTLARAAFANGRIYCAMGSSVFLSGDGKWRKLREFDSRVQCVAHQGGQRPRLLCLLAPTAGTNPLSKQRAPLSLAWSVSGKWQQTRIGTMPVGASCRLLLNPADPKKIRVFLLPLLWAHKSAVLAPSGGGETTIFASNDGGRTWGGWRLDMRVHSPMFRPGEAGAIYAGAAKRTRELIGLHKSMDGGRTWKRVCTNPKAQWVRSFLFHPKTKELYLGTTDVGLLKTSDFGKTCTALSDGLLNWNVSALAADPADENVLYAGTQWGMNKSTDGGRSWKWACDGLAGCQITGLVTFPGAAGRICLFEFHQGMRASDDGGKTWSPARKLAGLGGQVGWVRSAGAGVAARSVTARGPGYSLSGNHGRTWRRVEGLGKTDSFIGIVSAKELYAVRDAHQLLRSSDGRSWQSFAGPFQDVGKSIWWVRRRRAADHVIVGGSKGVYLCRADTGKTLAYCAVPAEIGPLRAAPVVRGPTGTDSLYLVNEKFQLVRLDLATRRWAVPDVPGSAVVGVVFDPGKRRRMIAAFGDGHLAATDDSGRTWTPLRRRWPVLTISHIAVTPERRLVVAANGTVHTLSLGRSDPINVRK